MCCAPLFLNCYGVSSFLRNCLADWRSAVASEISRPPSASGQITCVNINNTTTTSGTPNNQRIIGMSTSGLQSGAIA